MNNTIKKLSSNAFARILIVIVCWFTSAFLSFQYLYFLKRSNNHLSVKTASSHLPEVIIQNIIAIMPTALLLFGSILIWKSHFKNKLFFTIEKKSQKITVAVLSLILAIMFICALIVKEDKITVCYQLIYYLVFISFFEEFEFRGLYPALLKDKVKDIYVIILPNILFGMVHIFSYNNFNEPSVASVIGFITGQFLGLFLIGLIFETLKRKFGTIWVPILVHAIFDFSGVF